MNNPLTPTDQGTLFRWSLTFGLIVAVLLSTAAADSVLSQKIKAGRSALNAEDFERAQQHFTEGLEIAQSTNKREWQLNALFYLGLTSQQQARSAAGTPQENTFLSQATDFYKQCLSLQPDFGPALNNLAQLYAELGQNDESVELLQRAVRLDDSRKPQYLFNYAEFLSQRPEKWQEAADSFKQVVYQQPQNDKAHQNVLSLYLIHGRLQVLDYFWDLINRGQVLRVQESALELLSQDSWTEVEKTELLTIVVVCLKDQHYDPIGFLDTKPATTLRSLSQQLSLRYGINEILRLHQGEHFNPADYPWWRHGLSLDNDAPRGVWPLEGFRQLSRSLGDWYRKMGRTKQAESYYRLATRLHPDDPDPEAYLNLADLYIETDNLAQLERLIRRSEVSLFHGKGEAYRNSQLKKIYQYHRALGIIYSYLPDRWGDSQTAASAIFQLEHAQKTAELYNTRAEEQGRSDRLTVEPRLINRLALGYESTGNYTNALESFKASLNTIDGIDSERLPALLDSINQFVKTGKVTPTADAKRATVTLEPLRSEILRSPSGNGSRPILQSPVFTAVRSTQPLLRWSQVKGARAYQVIITDPDDNVLWESPRLKQTEIKVDSNKIQSARVYHWQAIAFVGREELISPIAGFWVLNRDALREVTTIERYFPDSPLMLASIYQAHGLYEEALTQVAYLMKTDPKNRIAQQMRDNLRRQLGLKPL